MNRNGIDYEISVDVIEEAGYASAMEGLSYNKNQPIERMPEVAFKLAKMDGGHNKFLEQIELWLRVRAPRYWWQEADTYRHSSKSSESTMHTILDERLTHVNFEAHITPTNLVKLNSLLASNDLVALKRALPEGFMQKRMWHMNYKCMRNIILQRRKHRLPHWQTFISSVLEQVKHPDLLPEL